MYKLLYMYKLSRRAQSGSSPVAQISMAILFRIRIQGSWIRMRVQNFSKNFWV